MGLDDRLRRLEHQPTSEATLRDRAEEAGREHDLNPEDIYEELVRFLALPPDEREALYQQRRPATPLRADQDDRSLAGAGGHAGSWPHYRDEIEELLR